MNKLSLSPKGLYPYQEHDVEGALRHFKQASIFDPDNPEVYGGLLLFCIINASIINRWVDQESLAFNMYLTGLGSQRGSVRFEILFDQPVDRGSVIRRVGMLDYLMPRVP